MNAVLCAAGFNIKWLMRAILAKGIKPLFVLYCVIWRWLTALFLSTAGAQLGSSVMGSG